MSLSPDDLAGLRAIHEYVREIRSLCPDIELGTLYDVCDRSGYGGSRTLSGEIRRDVRRSACPDIERGKVMHRAEAKVEEALLGPESALTKPEARVLSWRTFRPCTIQTIVFLIGADRDLWDVLNLWDLDAPGPDEEAERLMDGLKAAGLVTSTAEHGQILPF
jgi:hypothetical protein